MKELNLIEMEQIEGGYECNGLSAALGGVGVIIGVSSWWTGAGAGLSAIVGAAAFGAYLAGC